MLLSSTHCNSLAFPKMSTLPTSLPKASLIKRFAAFFYDLLLLTAIYLLIGACAVTLNRGESVPLSWSLVISLGIFPLTAFLFYAWFWRRGGQTLGMQAWRLTLIADSGPITLTHCLSRYCVSILSLACIGLGFFWIWLDKHHRSWQDIASHSHIYQLPKP